MGEVIGRLPEVLARRRWPEVREVIEVSLDLGQNEGWETEGEEKKKVVYKNSENIFFFFHFRKFWNFLSKSLRGKTVTKLTLVEQFSNF